MGSASGSTVTSPPCSSYRARRRRNGSTGSRAFECPPDTSSRQGPGFPIVRSRELTGGSTGASATTRSRSASITATASTPSGCSRVTRTGCSTPSATAPSRTGRRSTVRWSGGSSARDGTFRGGCSRRCGATARASCSRTCSPRARCRFSPRRGVSGCRSWRTSRAGTTPSGRASSRRHCDLYVVQNRVMEDDLAATTGSSRSAYASPGGRRPICSTLSRPRAAYDEVAAALRARSWAPAGPRRGEHAEQHAVRGALRRASRRVVAPGVRATAWQLLFRPHPRDGSWRERFAAAAGHDGVVVQEASYADLDDLATLLQHVDVRRLQRRHDPPRRARGRPSRCLRALRRGSAAGRVVGGEERRRRSTTRSSRPPAPSTAPSASRRSSPASSARSSIRTSSLRRGAGRWPTVVGVVDGRAAERVVASILEAVRISPAGVPEAPADD